MKNLTLLPKRIRNLSLEQIVLSHPAYVIEVLFNRSKSTPDYLELREKFNNLIDIIDSKPFLMECVKAGCSQTVSNIGLRNMPMSSSNCYCQECQDYGVFTNGYGCAILYYSKYGPATFVPEAGRDKHVAKIGKTLAELKGLPKGLKRITKKVANEFFYGK